MGCAIERSDGASTAACRPRPGSRRPVSRPGCPSAYSGPNRSLIPAESDRRFRSKSSALRSELSGAGQPAGRETFLLLQEGRTLANRRLSMRTHDSRGAAAVLRRGVEHPSHRPQPGDVAGRRCATRRGARLRGTGACRRRDRVGRRPEKRRMGRSPEAVTPQNALKMECPRT